MIIDTETQRTILLQLIQAATFPGAALDDIYGLKQAIKAAKLLQEEQGAPEKTADDIRREVAAIAEEVA